MQISLLIGFNIIFFSSFSVIAGTHYAFSAPINLSTQIESKPTQSSLNQIKGFKVWPNPLSSGQEINFSLKGNYKENNTHLSLRLYNVSGELVKTIPGSRIRANSQFIWNRRDQKGNMLPAGIYVAKLKVGNKTFKEKFTLLK